MRYSKHVIRLCDCGVHFTYEFRMLIKAESLYTFPVDSSNNFSAKVRNLLWDWLFGITYEIKKNNFDCGLYLFVKTCLLQGESSTDLRSEDKLRVVLVPTQVLQRLRTTHWLLCVSWIRYFSVASNSRQGQILQMKLQKLECDKTNDLDSIFLWAEFRISRFA